MPVVELHFFAPNDLNGDTIFECSSDDSFFLGLELDIQRDKLGSGLVTFARKVPLGLFTNDILKPEVFVRVLIPEVHATRYLHGFFLDTRQQQVVSTKEKGGKGFKFGGPGPKFYLTRQVVWSASFLGFDNAYDRDAGVVTWPSTARSGAILNRLILEDAANPSGPFLPDLTKSFSDANDSNGTPWADDISGTDDFTLNMQDDYLKVLYQLENASEIVSQFELGEVGDPLMQLDAYQSFGRDLTGPIGAGNVHFVEGVNIAEEMIVEGESLRKASHALVRGKDGVFELAVHPSGIGYKKVLSVDYTSSSNNTVLDQAGRRALARQVRHEFAPEIGVVPGFDDANGLYFPGPDGTDGHFWVGDATFLTTGLASPTELDYNDTDVTVTGIVMRLGEAVKSSTPTEVARSWEITVHGNESRSSDSTTPDRGSSAGSSNCSCLRLCKVATPGTDNSVVFTRTWDYENGDATTNSTLGDYPWPAALNGGVSAPLPAFGGSNYGRSTGSPSVSAPRMPCVPGGEITLEGEIARNWFSETLAVKKYTIRFYAGSSGGSVISSEILSPPACSRSVLASYSFTVIAPGGANYFTLQLADNAAQDNVTVTSYDTDGEAPIEGGTPTPIIPQAGDPGTSAQAARCDHVHEYHHPIAAEIDYENDASGLTAENVQTAIDELAAAGGVTLSDDTPLVESGAGDEGTSGEASRSDHVHPAMTIPTVDFVAIAKWGTD